MVPRRQALGGSDGRPDQLRALQCHPLPGDGTGRGESLAQRVARGPLPEEEALQVCRQIAEGVEAAHEKGVIHRLWNLLGSSFGLF